MKDQAWIHRQRAIVLIVVALGIGLCYLPVGTVPTIWTLHGFLLARRAAWGLVVWTALVLLAGRRARMGAPAWIAAGLTTVLILGFATFRMVALGRRSMPTFEDDDPQAAVYYQKACDAGTMEACSLLGTCYWTGSCGLAKDGNRGLSLFEQACSGGDMEACGQLGACYEVGGCGLMKNGQRAVTYYARACDGGDASMCNNLGVCYHKGECGLSKDDARAAQLYKRACQGGDAGGCHNLDLLKN